MSGSAVMGGSQGVADLVVRLVRARMESLRSLAREMGIAPPMPDARRVIAAPVTGRRAMSVVQALEWAFAVEHAQLDFEGDQAPEGYGCGVSTVWVIMQRGNLGCDIDGGGRSSPASDADIIAAAVAALPTEHGGRGMAVQIAEYARAGRVPDWMPDARPRVVPVDWRETKHGRFARTEVVERISYRHRGRLLSRDVLCCPVRIVPTASQIAAARRNYLNWCGAILHLQWWLSGALDGIDLTGDLPALTPWRKGD